MRVRGVPGGGGLQGRPPGEKLRAKSDTCRPATGVGKVPLGESQGTREWGTGEIHHLNCNSHRGGKPLPGAWQPGLCRRHPPPPPPSPPGGVEDPSPSWGGGLPRAVPPTGAEGGEGGGGARSGGRVARGGGAVAAGKRGLSPRASGGAAGRGAAGRARRRGPWVGVWGHLANGWVGGGRSPSCGVRVRVAARVGKWTPDAAESVRQKSVAGAAGGK